VYGTCGLGRGTGYNNKTTKNLNIVFYDVSSFCFFNMSERTGMCLLPLQGRTRAV